MEHKETLANNFPRYTNMVAHTESVAKNYY